MSAKVRSGLTDSRARAERKMHDYSRTLVNTNSAVEIGAIFDEDGNKLADIGSGEGEHITFTDEQARMAEGSTVVHWHPEDLPISYGDAVASSFMRGIWAVSSGGIYSFRWNQRMTRAEGERYRSIFKAEHDALKERALKIRDALYPKSELKDEDGRAKPAFRNPDGTVNRAKVDKWLEDRKNAHIGIYRDLVDKWYRNNQTKYGFTYSSTRWKK